MSDDVVNAIHDLTRVTIALHGTFGSRSEAVRRLYALSIPVARIAAILAMPVGDVSSAISKARRMNSSKGRIEEAADGHDGEKG